MVLIESEEGLKRLRTFVRRYKRKGGENGEPGDLDGLIQSLMSFCDGEIEEENLRNLLEGDDDSIWNDYLKLSFEMLSKES